ncbi:MAG: hypothetical protein KY461_11300 [Actinobacteria bacterium]|nr:hypothetical protein [Actinomycetota bacterium]
MPTSPRSRDTTTATLSAVEGAVPAPPPPPGALRGARVAAVAFLVLIAVPSIAYAVGVRPPDGENRTPTAAPPAGAVAALEEEALGQLTDHLEDALPGRHLAVRADAWLDLTLFGTSPSDEVLVGRDHWLFLRATVEARCRPDAVVEAMGAELERAADLVARTGRRLHTLIAPDKATMHPERLPDDPAAVGCGQVFGEQIRRLLEPAPPPGYLPFWSRLEELRDRRGEPLYFAADTHWRSDASAVMVETIVDALDGSLFDDAVPRRGEQESFTGDLTLLTGLPRTEVASPLVLDRPGVAWDLTPADGLPAVPDGVRPVDVSLLTATGAAVFPDRVTMLHDSFAYQAPPQLAPFFAELVMVRKHGPTVPWVGRLVASSQVVVFEVVERDAWGRIVADHLAGSLAAALRDDLPTTPVWLRPAPDGWGPLTLHGGDVLVVPGVAAAEEDEPFVLEVRRRGGEVVELASQRAVRAGEELVFDTVGPETPPSLPLGAVEVRLLTPSGEVVDGPVRMDVVATR